MIELIIGAFIGAITSIAIAEIYHRRSSSSLRKEIERLEASNNTLLQSIKNLEDLISNIKNDTEVTRQNVIVGTPDVPRFPYK